MAPEDHGADQVVADTLTAARTVFGPDLAAVFILGSLAHGGFAPLVSDVDVAIVLTTAGPNSAAGIDEVKRRVLDASADPLAERLSLFWGDWHAVRIGEGDHLRLGPIDRLDLLDCGELIHGEDRRAPSRRPSADELVLMSADHILGRMDDEELARLGDVARLVEGGPRSVTKAVLFPVRFMFTLCRGEIGLNDAAARWYAGQERPGGRLALQALEWRREGISDDQRARHVLEADLKALYSECITAYARGLEARGDAVRAAALTERAAAVDDLMRDPR